MSEHNPKNKECPKYKHEIDTGVPCVCEEPCTCPKSQKEHEEKARFKELLTKAIAPKQEAEEPHYVEKCWCGGVFGTCPKVKPIYFLDNWKEKLREELLRFVDKKKLSVDNTQDEKINDCFISHITQLIQEAEKRGYIRGSTAEMYIIENMKRDAMAAEQRRIEGEVMKKATETSNGQTNSPVAAGVIGLSNLDAIIHNSDKV